MDVKLRECEADDLQTLYEIDQACYPPGIAYSKRTLRWFLALPGAEGIVAEIGKEIAGFILTEHETEDGGIKPPLRTANLRGHIITLDVLEKSRQRGMGSALLGEAERRMAARGVERVELETAVNNAPAIAFWEKHGYRTGGVIKRYYLGRVDAYWMDKNLI